MALKDSGSNPGSNSSSTNNDSDSGSRNDDESILEKTSSDLLTPASHWKLRL